MVTPKLVTNEILIELKPSLDAGRLLLNDFEKPAMLRRVRGIEMRYQSLAMEGLLHFLDGQFNLGTGAFERSIDVYSSDGVTCAHYSSILARKGLYVQAENLFNRAIGQSIVQVTEQVLEFAAFWCDMYMMERALSMAVKYGYEITDSDNALSRLHLMKEFDSSLAEDVRNVTTVVRKIAEEHGLLCRKSSIEDDGYGEFAFSCTVNVEDVDTLTQLNARIIDDMVSLGYENRRCVAYFESMDNL